MKHVGCTKILLYFSTQNNNGANAAFTYHPACRYTFRGPTVVPPGHVWMQADNTKLHPPTIIDSRTHGPVPFENIIGRVVYYVASRTDHGMVNNSREALAFDEAVLNAEVDIE